jgi:hypothetical protein
MERRTHILLFRLSLLRARFKYAPVIKIPYWVSTVTSRVAESELLSSHGGKSAFSVSSVFLQEMEKVNTMTKEKIQATIFRIMVNLI